MRIYTIFLLFTSLAFSQAVPNQQDYFLKNLWRLASDVQVYPYREFADHSGLTTFQKYLRIHHNDFTSSPFGFFYVHRERLKPNKEDHFSFANTNSDFSEIVRLDYGVCAGMSVLLRKFHRLAFFDPNNITQANVPSRYKELKSWKKFYYKQIKRIQNLKPAIFPHFKSLNELSSDPILKKILKETSLQEWAIKNATIGGALQVLETIKEKMKPTEIRKLYTNLQLRLDLDYKPIVFTVEKSKKIFTTKHRIHVLNVTKIIQNPENQDIEIHFWDINYSNINSAAKKAIIHPDGTISGDYSNLSRIQLYPYDDFEISRMLKNQMKWCKSNPIRHSVCEGSLY